MLEPGKYFNGTEIRLTIAFTDDDGDFVDPDTVTFKTCSPSGVISSYVYGTDSEVQKASTGNYTADISPDQGGRWFYRWESTGTAKKLAKEGNFVVQLSPFIDGVNTGYALR